MGYIFDFKDAIAYQNWAEHKRSDFVTRLEADLMCDMLKPVPRETVLDIGCGIGTSLRILLGKGLDVTGLDPSPYMLDMACRNVKNRVDLYRGFAEDLPFEDNSFNYAVFFTSLEFVDDPQAALQEACRVAKDKVFVGVLNRYAIKGVQRRLKGVFTQSIYNRARFFSVWELKADLKKFVGDVPIRWKTVYHLPLGQGRVAQTLESAKLMQRFPFGAFAGVSAVLVPRFKTRPLTLKYAARQHSPVMSGSGVSGMASDELAPIERKRKP
jgi:SAM-dependent methyltransferase